MQTVRSEQIEQRVAGCLGAASHNTGCTGTTGQREGNADGGQSQAGSAYMIVSGSARRAGTLFH
jgi:hypothetical protein